jgi:hypothetical protein
VSAAYCAGRSQGLTGVCEREVLGASCYAAWAEEEPGAWSGGMGGGVGRAEERCGRCEVEAERIDVGEARWRGGDVDQRDGWAGFSRCASFSRSEGRL